MFHELRLSMEALAYSPKCPGFAKNIIYKVALNENEIALSFDGIFG